MKTKKEKRTRKSVMTNKRAMEISINFVVMLILGLAMLGGSFILVQSLFGKADQYQKNVDAQTQREITRLQLDTNALVILNNPRQVIHRKDFGVFGIGVQNNLGDGGRNGPSDPFVIGIQFDKAFDKNRVLICNKDSQSDCHVPNPDDWLTYAPEQTIKKNDLKVFNTIIKVPRGVKAGIYIFDVRVCEKDRYSTCDDNVPKEGLYGTTLQKIYVSVE